MNTIEESHKKRQAEWPCEGGHEWETEIDSQWHSMHSEAVYCKKCGCPGARTIKTGKVFWPAT